MDRALAICRSLAIVLGAVVASAGCGGYTHVPWLNPGRAEVQQIRALREHDPYPDPDAGPDFLGSRPREFDTPPPEPAWAQQRSPRGQRFPSYAPAPVYGAAPIITAPAPVVTTPPVIAPGASYSPALPPAGAYAPPTSGAATNISPPITTSPGYAPYP